MNRPLNSDSLITPSTLVEDGEAFYEKHLKAALEPNHSGDFIAIEPATGRYFLGNTATAALVAARDAMPNSQVFLTRIGRRSAHRIRRTWFTNRTDQYPLAV